MVYNIIITMSSLDFPIMNALSKKLFSSSTEEIGPRANGRIHLDLQSVEQMM